MKLQKETKTHGRWYNDACGTAYGLELAGERWSLLVIRELMLGPLRFSDIRANLPGISAKTLTERLEGLEQAGAVRRSRLPAPVSANVYELTEWGYAAEPVIQELGRWAALNPGHDPTLPLSPVSFLLSLRTMFSPARAGDARFKIGFVFGDLEFVGMLENGAFTVSRQPAAGCDAVFSASSGAQLAAVVYGAQDPQSVGVAIDGDMDTALRFAQVFELPAKLSVE